MECGHPFGKKLEELYKDLHLGRESHFLNGINMSIWGTNYAWSKLRWELAVCRLQLDDDIEKND
jgi:hypothetical protein